MEARHPALNAPPAILEGIVLRLIPAYARETVAGDLREIYVSPAQYLLGALQAVPFVIASQARRSANLPLLGLQGALIFVCAGGLDPIMAGRAGWLEPALVTAATLLFLLLFGAFQGSRDPSSRWEILETIIAGAALLFYADSVLFELQRVHEIGTDHFAFLLFIIIGPFLLPMACSLRAAIILARSESGGQMPASAVSAAVLMLEYRNFQEASQRRGRWESISLIGVAGAIGWSLPYFPDAYVPVIECAIGVYLVVAIHLWTADVSATPAQNADFLSLRAFYQRQLVQQHQLRQLVWWLWPSPLFLTLHAGIFGPGTGGIRTLYETVTVVLICLCIAAINRERSGEVQEQMALLARMRERKLA